MKNKRICMLVIAAAALGALAGAAATQPDKAETGGQPDFSKMSKDDLLKVSNAVYQQLNP